MGFSSTPGKIESLDRFNKGQQGGFAQAQQMGMAGLKNPTAGFAPQADLARRQYSQQGIPGLAERFSGLGAGSQRSSAFTGELAKGQGDLEAQLAALASQYGLQQQGLSQQLLGLGLTPQQEHMYKPGEEGWGSKLGGMAAQFGGSALGSYLGGGAGAAGGGIMSILSSLLGGGNKGGGQVQQQGQQGQQQYGPVAQGYQGYQSPMYNNMALLNGGRM